MFKVLEKRFPLHTVFVRQHPSSEKLQACKHDILLKSNT
jgi:hypothetical protein